MILGSQLVVPGLSSGGTSLPTGFVGVMMDWPGTVAPTGWVFAFGQSLLRASFPALFTAIGTTYGAADGTHFNVPDLRGRVVAGKDDMGGVSANRLTGLAGGVNGDNLAATGGEEAHVLTIEELASHNHNYDGTAPGSDLITVGGGNFNATNNVQTSNTGGDTAHNNVQPTIILNKIIYTGV